MRRWCELIARDETGSVALDNFYATTDYRLPHHEERELMFPSEHLVRFSSSRS